MNGSIFQWFKQLSYHCQDLGGRLGKTKECLRQDYDAMSLTMSANVLERQTQEDKSRWFSRLHHDIFGVIFISSTLLLLLDFFVKMTFIPNSNVSSEQQAIDLEIKRKDKECNWLLESGLTLFFFFFFFFQNEAIDVCDWKGYLLVYLSWTKIFRKGNLKGHTLSKRARIHKIYTHTLSDTHKTTVQV